MALKWPLLLLLVIVGIGVAVAFLRLRRSRHGWQGELPLLARSFRITELPEYQRALRFHQRVSAAALVMSIVAVAMLIGATARPVWTYQRTQATDTPHVDIMLCFGDQYSILSGNGYGLGSLLTDLKAKVDAFGNQRIGMTKDFYRAIPVTADRQWVTQRFDAMIGITKEYDAQLKQGPGVTPTDDGEIFERNYRSAAVQPNPLDTLAMCTMGLPAVGSDNGRGRMIVYVGKTELFDDPDPTVTYTEPPKRIYTKDAVEKAVKSARIQVNAILPARSGGQRPVGFFEQLINDTGGKEIEFTPGGGGDGEIGQHYLANMNDELSTAVDKVMANPPPSVLDDQQKQTGRTFQWDVPDLLLQIALIAAVALAACRVGMRL